MLDSTRWNICILVIVYYDVGVSCLTGRRPGRNQLRKWHSDILWQHWRLHVTQIYLLPTLSFSFSLFLSVLILPFFLFLRLLVSETEIRGEEAEKGWEQWGCPTYFNDLFSVFTVVKSRRSRGGSKPPNLCTNPCGLRLIQILVTALTKVFREVLITGTWKQKKSFSHSLYVFFFI